MAKQSLKVSLWMIWGLSVVGMLALAISGVFYLDRAESNVDHFVRQPIALRHSSTMLYALGLQRGQALRNVILDPGNSKAYENYAKAEEGFQAEMQQFAMLKAEDAKQVDLQDRVRQLAAAWSPLQQKVLALGREGKVDEAKQLLISQETPQWRKLREDLLELGTRSSTSAEAARNELQATLHTSKILAIAIGVAGFVVISFAVGYLGRNVYRQIGGEPGYAGTVLAKLSDGDLRQKVEIGSDAQGSLLLAIQEMQARIRTLVAQVAAAAQSVVGASGSMRDDAVRLTATANQQGSSTAAIAATVDTFRVGIARMSEGAKQAGWLAKESSDQAKRTLEVVSSAVTTMHTVSTETTLASRSVDKLSQNISQISSILEKIKDIADQTNLLALNAAIEAARAGEQGRGFAVVADEVRKLAELTAKSTTEISEIVGGIDTTSGEVVSSMARAHAQSEQGADKADQVGLAVQAMHGLTVQVTDALGGIADRLQEQLAASGEIADAVQTIAQSSRDVHEISTASSKHAATLVQLSGNLTGCIDQFRL